MRNVQSSQMIPERFRMPYNPASLLCRDFEFQTICSFVRDLIDDKRWGCAHIYGGTGTVKTATVIQMVRKLQERGLKKQFELAEVKCKEWTKPNEAYVQVCLYLTGKTLAWKRAQLSLEKRFTDATWPTVLLIYDLDGNRKNDDVYNFLDCAFKPGSRLVVITIGNSIFYPERASFNPWYQGLLSHMSPSVTDSALITKIKRIGLEYWKNNVGPNIIMFHDLATFLHPLMKGMKTHTSSRRMHTFDKVKQMLGHAPVNRRESQENTMLASSAMRRFVDIDSDTEECELDEYNELKVRSITSLLQWWCDRKTTFPKLYQIARYIHAIPASSASAERVFSVAGRLCTNRPNLKSEKMDEILFLRSNYDLMDEAKREKLLESEDNESETDYSSEPEI